MMAYVGLPMPEPGVWTAVVYDGVVCRAARLARGWKVYDNSRHYRREHLVNDDYDEVNLRRLSWWWYGYIDPTHVLPPAPTRDEWKAGKNVTPVTPVKKPKLPARTIVVKKSPRALVCDDDQDE